MKATNLKNKAHAFLGCLRPSSVQQFRVGYIFFLSKMAVEALPAEQLNKVKEIFARFDLDSDGRLTVSELGALLRSIGLTPSGDKIRVLFENKDTTGDHLTGFDKLIDAVSPKMNDTVFVNQEKLLQVFDMFDRDGSGSISAAELVKSMAKMEHPLTEREFKEIMKEADADGDGTISFNEFVTVMAKSAVEFLGVSIS